jgi:flagellar export protein FliJ
MNRKRLAAVLRIRELQERGARGELARTRRDHETSVATEQRMWEHITAFGTVQGRTLTPADLHGRQQMVASGVLSAQSQHIVTERALIAVDVAHEEWTVAARRVEALERLSERLIESEREESSRLQSNEIDDLVLARRGHGDDAEAFS